MNAHAQIADQALADPVYSYIADFWIDLHGAKLDPEKVAHAFRSLWHGSMVGVNEFAEDFCAEFGSFEYEYSRAYRYGDHSDTGGGIICQDVDDCTFFPNDVERKDITNALGLDALDLIDAYGMENHETYGERE